MPNTPSKKRKEFILLIPNRTEQIGTPSKKRKEKGKGKGKITRTGKGKGKIKETKSLITQVPQKSENFNSH